MPKELYVQVEGEDGQPSFVPLSEVEEIPEDVVIPEPVVQRTEAFNSLLNHRNEVIGESKKRLRRAQKAEQALAQYTQQGDDVDDEDDNDSGDTTPTPSPQPQLDKDELFSEFRQRLAQEAAEAASKNQAQEVLIEKLVAEHKLQGIQGIKGILANSTDPTSTAAALGRNTLVFDDMQGGETAMQDLNEAAIGKVYEMLGLPQPKI